ncbi:MAG TPA: metallophosphoesterase [Blastocatellia bacterium]|nr:metallophosphoesterase [Blastocatellia bacterium]
MKKILHFSDIHFGGAHAPGRAEAILAEVDRSRPDVVTVSGDLTQRARSFQFRQAREFLDRISAPIVVVPGNHDVPLWHVFDRFLSPLDKYKRWITNDLNPFYKDDEIAVVGIDTTLSFTIKGGEIADRDLRRVRELLSPLPPTICKVVVGHHPFAPPPGIKRERAVGGARRAMRCFEKLGVEMVLTGHLHHTYITSSRDLYPTSRHGVLLVQAGTVASLRGRASEHKKNSFNLIEVDDREITTTSYIYSDESFEFAPQSTHTWARPAPFDTLP